MNQILTIKVSRLQKKRIFLLKLQLILSTIFVVILFICYIHKIYLNFKYENFSKTLYQNLKVLSIYNSEANINNNVYLGSIKIEKIGIEYPIFNYLDYDSLRVAPCRFFGEIENNLCIAGHNYNDSRFFSKISTLSKNDSIIISDLSRK